MRSFLRPLGRTVRFFAAPLALALVVPPAGLTPRCFAADEQAELEQRAFRAAVDRVAPCVVQIETIGGRERMGEIALGIGPTTGLVVSPDGYIVSSAFHFVGTPSSTLVQMPGGGRKPARLVATDHNRMFVLLKVEPDRPLPVPEPAPMAGVRVGQWAVGVGRTFETSYCNMSVGVVSALNRIWGKAIQTDAAVSPNNYGGPLVDLQGRVLGVLVPLSPQESSELAGYEWYDSGIGFAVPFETVLQLVSRLKEGKDLHPGVIGIQLPMQTLVMSDPVLGGCRPRSPAYRGGLRRNDRIESIDGAPMSLASQVKEQIARRYAGDTLRVVAKRGDKRIEAHVALVKELDPFQPPFLGILPVRVPPKAPSVAKVMPPVKDAPAKPAADPAKSPSSEKPAAPEGVDVRYVFPAGPAAGAGLAAGDRIVRAAGEPIGAATALRQVLTDREPGEKIELEIVRAGQSRKLEVALAALPEAIPPADIPPPSPVEAVKPPAGKVPAEKPAADKPPQTGSVHLKAPGMAQDVWAYVPAAYRPEAPCGIVVWLAGGEEITEQALVARWQPLCDRHGMIALVLQAAERGQWKTADGQQIPRVLSHLATVYRVDPSRVAIVGRHTGGTLALQSAFRYSGLLRAAVAVDAALPSTFTVREPPLGTAFLLATSKGAASAAMVKDTAARLRKWQYPVTTLDLGAQPRELDASELAQVVRWIDALDRL